MVRKQSPGSFNMTQTYGSPDADGQQSCGYSSPPPSGGQNQVPVSSDHYGDRGLSDEYYGRSDQHGNSSQPPPYAQLHHDQQQYGYQQYGQPQYGQANIQQYSNPVYPQQGQCGPSQSYPGYGSPGTGYPYSTQTQNSTYQQPQALSLNEAPTYSSAPYDPTAPPPIPVVKLGGGPPDPDDPEQRGIMGALAGGAAGGYAGHKMHHGVLGTLGGAYAGHKLEEAYKEHHQKPPVQPTPANQPSVQPRQMLGNFSASSRKISLDRDYDLIAEVATISGDHRLSSISLNACLTNDNGQFRWQRDGGFGASAREVHLTPNGKELRAELRAVDGRWQRSSIRLDERITNSDGNLQVVW